MTKYYKDLQTFNNRPEEEKDFNGYSDKDFLDRLDDTLENCTGCYDCECCKNCKDSVKLVMSSNCEKCSNSYNIHNQINIEKEYIYDGNTMRINGQLYACIQEIRKKD